MSPIGDHNQRSAVVPAHTVARQITDDTISDSGYGGSIAGESNFDQNVPAQILPGVSGNASETERRQWASNVHQLHYNQNRVALGRSINTTIDLLKDFSKKNSSWPAHYPQISKAGAIIQRSQTTEDLSSDEERPKPLRRSATSIEPATPEEEPKAAEPRLVTPQIVQEFNVLKLDLKLGALSPSELVHSLEKSSIASLLDGKISQSIKHLQALRERIEDTSSKVLVTGDLNAGKSTFCNALLRKKVLPEDQQPCTSIFCEVLDCRDNGGVEEVHAVHFDTKYNRDDETTYDVHKLEELEDIVIENDKYPQVKVYVEDVRTIDQSLLRNGVVDIALIDAPGLNLDSIKTTAVFARQEEIDVVVFVVSAENHFTLSAKEFIWNAAQEKAYIFIVVNRFDNIRDKARCKRLILEQIQQLSPRTYEHAEELVHFVSSNAVIEDSEATKVQQFETLEQSLRSFVLEKRARSKLAPAKTYLMNLLGDIETLATSNQSQVGNELDRINEQLAELTPVFEEALRASTKVTDDVDRSIEDTAAQVYKHTRRELIQTIKHMDDVPSVPYAGIFDAYTYAEQTRVAMLDKVHQKVISCEGYARDRTVQGVSAIKSLGLLHLGDDYIEKIFRADLMFSRKKDALVRAIKTEIDVLDFFDFDKQEKAAGFGLSFTLVATLGGQFLGIGGWIDGVWKTTKFLGYRNTKKLIVPVALVAGAFGAYWLLADIPNAVPRKLAKKIRKELEAMDYVHGNSERITKEVRKILRVPADDLRGGFQRVVEKRGKEREQLKEQKKESEVALKYFGNLYRKSTEISKGVNRLDLDNVPIAH
ncbi:hypothetical protein DFH27DRAFT_531652 [Peziza echinospora]|nr:hypothetical protein DFH27DRAFT_531652 [Peziza echinospora]